MSTTFQDIHQIVNPLKFQKIQDDIAGATDLALITVDFKGKPVTRHSKCSPFCQKVRSSKYSIHCEKCDSHGGLEAARQRKPFIYICHAGLVDFAIPILVNGLYLGAFMGGQILVQHSEDSSCGLEHILPGASVPSVPFSAEYQTEYDQLPVMSMDKIHSLANMLMHIGNYCVKEAELKALLPQRYDKNPRLDSASGSSAFSGSASDSEADRQDGTSMIQSGLDYIQKHPQDKITLEKMASICNISPSYFSKLFARENLGTLSDYVNQVKMEHARLLLTSTSWKVHIIGEHVGFDDCGYFIKVFKKNTTMTPMEYRDSMQQ